MKYQLCPYLYICQYNCTNTIMTGRVGDAGIKNAKFNLFKQTFNVQYIVIPDKLLMNE